MHAIRLVIRRSTRLLALAATCCGVTMAVAQERTPRQVSGIYPHLAMFNAEGECGTGAVVPWAGRLWAVTYAPHKPRGSSDKLYEITADLQQIVRPESIGGTPANRMVHEESQQLFLGPYAIDARGTVRVIPYDRMFGRPTGNARHLTDPANKIYCATMEEGLYEVDVHTLEVTELWADEQQAQGRHSDLPGYHGKGLYSGQGRIVYANNGEHGERARRDPTTPSGVLATWDGKAAAWTVVQRAQFTEVTGPGGIRGNARPDEDPIWAVGWDHRSLLLQVLDGGAWHRFRLPKGSHSYDGAHGWNTEWPRIRDVGEQDLLMTMHGLFWRFPVGFRVGATGGIRPRSAYLKVVGDFCRWQDRLVFGCDDTAKSEFLNKRRAKGEVAAPRSQSNLWFVAPDRIDELGPVRAVGSLWVHEDVAAGAASDPFLVAGMGRGGLHLAHRGDAPAEVAIEVDVDGSGAFRPWRTVTVPAGGYAWVPLGDGASAACWLRLVGAGPLVGAVAALHFLEPDARTHGLPAPFASLAAAGDREALGGFVRARGGEQTSLVLAAQRSVGAGGIEQVGCYEMDVVDGDLVLAPSRDPALHEHTLRHAAIPRDVLTIDDASVLYVDDEGGRWRLPKPEAAVAVAFGGVARVVREVATERDLLHAAGTFYELPAENAGGVRKLRPIASHDRFVHDFCSYRGLLVMTGLDPAAAAGPHVVRSTDGKAAVWVGAIDDLWRLGRARGVGGPWNGTQVEAGVPSDPYLVTGYEHKTIHLSHDGAGAVRFTLEADLCGDGRWTTVRAFEVPAGEQVTYEAPAGWSAYWLRAGVSEACRATVRCVYR